MNARVEMKMVRDWLRRQIKQINADPFLAAAHGRIEARIVKWEPRAHRVLVCIRDRAYAETPYNSNRCRWQWVSTYTTLNRWELWKDLNAIVVNTRYPNSFFE